MEHINKRGLHAVSGALSLNEAEQLVRILTRPIAETARLIEENIQLARTHRKKVLDNPQNASQVISQNDLTIVPLTHPRLVCGSEKCSRLINVGNKKKVRKYLSICHDECYLKGVSQETLADPKLREC
jgi:hypothetical protein